MTSVGLQPISLGALGLLARGDLAGAGAVLGRAVPPDYADAQWVWAHFLERVAQQPADAAWFTRYAVVQGPRIVGHAGLHSPPDADGEVHLGWHVDVVRRGRGIGTGTARALIDLLEPSGARAAVALIAHENQPSIRVAEHAGMVADGEQRHRFGWMMRRFVRRFDDPLT